MKFTISAINQIGIDNAGFIKKTDVVDWCLLDYIYDWQQNPKATQLEGKTWLSYKHLIAEMPLLGLNDKSSVSKRIKKLKLLELIDTFQSNDDCRLYVKTTPLYYDITRFKILPSTPVDLNQHPLAKINAPVDENQHPVDDGQHSTVIPITVIPINSKSTTTPTENFENLGTKLNALHHEVFEWACTDKYWVRCTNSEEDFLRAYCSPKGGMRKQFEQRHNVKQPTGGNNGTHRQPPKKLSPAERVRKAAGIGEFAVGAGGSEFDYLENRG